MSDARDHRFAACHAAAKAWLEDTLGVDLRRGGVARSVERHVIEILGADSELTAEAYARDLAVSESAAARALLKASTVTHSWLFRDAEQLEALRRALLDRPRGPLAVWVAGCAAGEEAYTVAAIALSIGHDIQVLATDVNSDALQRAARGAYNAWSAREVPGWARTYLRPQTGGGVVASAELRARVSFDHRSLMEAPPASPSGARGWDVVLCRNVLIYFARERALSIAQRLGLALAPQGLLVLGASDVLPDTPASLTHAGEASRQLLRRGALPVRVGAARVEKPYEALPPPQSSFTVAAPAPRPEVPPQPAATAAPPLTVDALLAEAQGRAETDPADPHAQAAVGMLLHARGDHERAVGHLRAAACLEPASWSIWLFLGIANERLGRWPEAHRAFRRALSEETRNLTLPCTPETIAGELRVSRHDLLEMAERRVRALDQLLQGAVGT